MDPNNPPLDQVSAIYATATTPTYVAPQPQLDWNSLVITPLQEMTTKTIAVIPNFIAALYILIVGWAVAIILKIFFAQFLKSINFDPIAKQAGINEALAKDNDQFSASIWFSRLAYWLTIMTAIVIALNRLQLWVASSTLNSILSLFIATLTSLVIIILGMFLSMILPRIVATTGKNLGVLNPSVPAGIIRWSILFFTLLLTFAQFHVRGEFVFMALGVVFVTVCATFILAFGIGGRQWAAKMLEKWF